MVLCVQTVQSVRNRPHSLTRLQQPGSHQAEQREGMEMSLVLLGIIIPVFGNIGILRHSLLKEASLLVSGLDLRLLCYL